MNLLRIYLIGSLLSLFGNSANSQIIRQTKGQFEDKFRQLDEALPTPNAYRNAAGQPGHEYWQQEADYIIEAELDEAARRIKANATITYYNNSPDTLEFLWLYLDQNIFREDSIKERTLEFGGLGSRGPSTSAPGSGNEPAKMSFHELRRQQGLADREYGFEILSVTTEGGSPLAHTFVGTLMRLDPKTPLAPGESITFKISWEHDIIEENAIWGRSGYEHFPDDEREGGNDIFLLAQWFPRMAAYTDYEGWHNKEFLGRGEFTLEFGDYNVSLTVPDLSLIHI